MKAATTLLVLVGPTAVGKTEVSLELATRLGAEIVSADSRYLYRGMDIGTAKPTAGELARVPHHLVDVTTPDRPWSLAQFQAAALAAIEAIFGRGRVPLLVGGTGQYIRAVTDGWQVPAGEPNPALRAELEALVAAGGPEALAQRLREVDPASAAVVDLHNPRRVIRALEVALATGQSFVGQRGKAPPPFRAAWLGLERPRPELFARIDARIEWMLQAGFVEEVRGLVARGYGWDLPAMSAIGYRQIGQYLQGEVSLETAVVAIRRATRQFVRRQANWFKPADPAIHWVRAEPGVAARLERYANQQVSE